MQIVKRKKHHEDIRTNLSLIFVELVKYKPKDKGSKAIKDLWLRYLTEIDEHTDNIDDIMLDNPGINQALQIVEKSAYSDTDLYAYNDYLLEVMTHHNSVLNALEDGRAIGKAEGRKNWH